MPAGRAPLPPRRGLTPRCPGIWTRGSPSSARGGSALAPDVAAAGAEFVDGAAVIDGQMVSARAWPDHPAWMREFMNILRSKAPA